MEVKEARRIADEFLKSCYEFWSGASHYISEEECEAIETLIEFAKEK